MGGIEKGPPQQQQEEEQCFPLPDLTASPHIKIDTLSSSTAKERNSSAAFSSSIAMHMSMCTRK